MPLKGLRPRRIANDGINDSDRHEFVDAHDGVDFVNDGDDGRDVDDRTD
jgi:hypothetical protein